MVSEEINEVQDEKSIKEKKDTENTSAESDAKEDATPSLHEMRIIRQIEYYFGDVNLRRDKFMQEKQTEEDGWITLECLTTFNRLKALTTDFEEIINSLKKSKTGLIEIHEDKNKIRRSLDKPVPDQDDPILRKASKMKTLFIQGFPTSYTLDDVQDFILMQQCQPLFTKMKRDSAKNFDGSVIIELTSLEGAQKLLNDKDLKCGDTTLSVMLRDDYYDSIKLQRKGNDEDDRNSPRNPEDIEEFQVPMSGCVLHFKGVGENTSREDLKKLFGDHEQIAWVDYSRGGSQGYIRFSNEGGAQRAIDAVKAANDDKILINNTESEVKVVEGIEEKNFWLLANEERRRPKQKFQRGGRRNRKDRNVEGFRKRRRPWEYSDKTDNSEGKPVNEHKTFDDFESKTDSCETEVKKTKVDSVNDTKVEE